MNRFLTRDPGSTAECLRRRYPLAPPSRSYLFRREVDALAAHREVATDAYRFRKLTGNREVYDAHVSTAGHAECSCPGCTFHKKPCKHLKMLVAAGMLPRTVLEPAVNREAL
jgi:hypothetical protein